MMPPSLQDAPCLYFAATDEGMLVSVNKMLCTLLGYNTGDLVGKKQDLIFSLPTRIFQQTHLFPLLQMQGHTEEIYITLLTKGGEWLPVLLNASRTEKDGEGLTEYVAIVVLNRKKFEDELVAAKKAAEAALHQNTSLLKAKQDLQQHAEMLDQQMALVKEQNEELRQFNHVVTHDMQEPLRKLLLFANMLLDEAGDANGKTVRKIKAVTEQMRQILSGLQQYVWLIEAPVVYTGFSLGEIIASLAEELREEHPLVSITLQCEELPQLRADKTQVIYLLKELMTNAVRFRKDPDVVTIRFSASLVQENFFRNTEDKYQYTDYLRIVCSDDGMGFDATYKDQVFELFKRLHPVSGRGVGLALCKKIVQKHGGLVKIESQQGQGTSIAILLPYQESSLQETRTVNEGTKINENES
ncbi:MAG: PAS domain-containing sensor histidine kinase [Chitinophagaceae bacterium]|nr:MAG: PAS domain-containing sensor histidine kinase [Chitinophagaceae bacterium]